jgi:hypothetical protein
MPGNRSMKIHLRPLSVKGDDKVLKDYTLMV